MPRSQAARTRSESLAASPTLKETAACLASSSVTSTRPCWTSAHWSRTSNRRSETVACCRTGLRTSCSIRKWRRWPARTPTSRASAGRRSTWWRVLAGSRCQSADRSRILQGMLTLPAHPDVRDGLQTMRDAGLRLVTLTNSAPAAVQQQLTNAGLTAFFERSFSVDTVRRFKPAAEAYQSVADSLGLPIDRLRLVAAHAWDIVGALRAGCAAAFVARPGKVLYPLGPKPDITGPDFRSVAKQIVAAESRQA